jgi:phosphate transport system permease protein
MTDLTSNPTTTSGSSERTVDFASAVWQARLAKRYAAERRFKAYGMMAIAFAGLFILFLVSDILIKGLPAFREHKLTLPLTATQELIGTAGKTDRESMMQGDWMAVVRASISEQFPEVTSRGQRSKLYNELISLSGGDDLRAKVIADPALIGKSVSAVVLLSDDADLYFKGSVTKRIERTAATTATISATTGDVSVVAVAPEFATDLARIRSEIATVSKQTLFESNRLKAGIAKQPVDKQQAFLEQVARQEKIVADLQSRAQAIGGKESIGLEVPTILIKANGGVIKVTELSDSAVSGTVLLPLKSTDSIKAGNWQIVSLLTPEGSRKLSDQQITWLDKMKDLGWVSSGVAWRFFTSGDSREPEQAGILGGLAGSALTMLVTLGLCLPIGVAAATYLEEFAPKNRFTDLIEVNINNLAAVPSIVFGLLGLAIFINKFDMPRSSALVGGLVLALLVLPTIIIASRAALKAVPPSIREAALGLGASHQQAVFHHVLPLAMPGILTGAIIGMAHALGETAPLLMIGMVAFIMEAPQSLTESATVLPVQIFLWSDLPEAAFQAKTAGAIIVLLCFLFVMNGAAIWLRKKFETRW